MGNDDLKTLIMEAVARGWGHPSNKHKIMDVNLAVAITDEVVKTLKLSGISDIS